jgi:NADH:ubiquinone oxidoreductase subunit E
MNPQQIEKRIEELKATAKQHEAVLLQISGAIQELTSWLSQEKSNAVDSIDDTKGS